MYTITLADGKKLERLDKNGDNFVSKAKIDESLFKDNLSKIIISDGKNETIYENVEFIQQMPWPDGTYYLAFRIVPESERCITDIQIALADIYEMVVGGK